MTPAEIQQLNIQVAEAIGLPVRKEDWYINDEPENPLENPDNYPYVQIGRFGLIYWDKPNEDGKEWNPATNWNQAMYAAEKAEMWKTPKYSDQTISLIYNNGYYAVCKSQPSEHVDCQDVWETIAEDQSGPIAICKAILFFNGG